MPKTKPTLIGLFAGVGGIEMGFRLAGFNPILANELDGYAAETYQKNNKHPLVVDDISNLSASRIAHALGTSRGTLPTVDVLAGGFPCQPFSVAGYRKGFDDERGNVYWQIHRLIRELKPKVVFLENVKNLRSHDGGTTFETILRSLRNEEPDPTGAKIGHRYHIASCVLNAKDFGVPQNRERIFIIAFRDKPALDRFTFPEPSVADANQDLSKFIDFETKLEAKYYYDSARPFYDELKSQVTDGKSIYQWRRQYVRQNKSGICPTLTANMGMGGHNVPIIKTKHGIRKLTPRECFALMGMPNLQFPEGMADSRLYKQAGNAVVVPVIEAIARKIKAALATQ
jgi:DNA (cytosine-5)-methyltransferase 1